MENNIKKRYDWILAPIYNRLQNHMLKYKKRAVEIANLKKGDSVLVFCCGSGMEFPFLEDIISNSGKIVGIDFSQKMLDIAKNTADKNGWKNISLYQGDATSFKLNEQFDAGFCTLGLSVINIFTCETQWQDIDCRH